MLKDGVLDLDTAVFDDGTALTLPSFDVPAPPNGAPIRVFVAKHLTLDNLTITSATAQASFGVGRAVAFLATDEIDVLRAIIRSGAVSIAGCDGGGGQTMTVQTPPQVYVGGSGGGGFAAAGGAGGAVNTKASGGSGGGPSGGPELIPLRGGCPGYRGAAGGAIQLVSRTGINLKGQLIAEGAPATRGGGGAGGGVLLEAPTITIAASGKILARGGGGAIGNAGTFPAPVPQEDLNRPPGASCGTTMYCGDAGSGGVTNSGLAGMATNPPPPPGPGGMAQAAGGSGGGGAGRIRMNTLSGDVAIPPTSMLGGVVTQGNATTN